MNPSVLGIVSRAVPVVFVLVGTLAAFGSGVDVSERPGVPDASIVVQLYYAIGLFVLGGLDLGVPVGGPGAARAVLWGAYFAGPAITTTAVVEGALLVARPAWLVRLRNRDHVVVVGDSALGRLTVQAVVASDPSRRHLVVTPSEMLQPVHGLDRARWVVVATSDDLQNLGVAWQLQRAFPRLAVHVHVGELGLRRSAAAVAESPSVEVFNAYEITADRVYASVLAPHLEHTAGRDSVAILGFGRFGQTVVRHLHERSRGEVANVVVVDHTASQKMRIYADQVDLDPDVVTQALDGNVADPAIWEQTLQALGKVDVRPLIVIATDDDQVNLAAAVGLRSRLPDARVFVRWANESAFLSEIERRHDVEGLAVQPVLREALAREYQSLG